MSRIEHVHARQILDSRGNPTVEVDVRLESGALLVPDRRIQPTRDGPIVIEPDLTARLADIHLRPMHTLDPPVLMALRDVHPTANLTQAAS